MKALAKAKSMKPGFSDGGEVVDYTDSETSTSSTPAATEAAPAPEYKSFKEAFAAERKSGSKSFEYKGKKYTTDVAAERSTARKPTPAAPKTRTLAPATSSDSSRLTKVPDSMGGQSYSGMGKSSKYASGGLVKRAAVKSHGKAC